MGNNKKTVKCSFCKRLGHNSVTCTVYKGEVEKLRIEFGSNHPDVVEYDSSKSNYSKKSSINANKKRTCSYCLEEGHNVRTCAEKRRAVSKLKKINSEWRKNVIAELTKRGIGIGSIMANETYVSKSENQKSPWTLTSIDWDNLNWVNDNRKAFRLILMSNPCIYREITLEQVINESKSYIHRWRVVSVSDNLDHPEGWESISDSGFDRDCIEIFDGITKDDYEHLFMDLVTDKGNYMYIDHQMNYIFEQFTGDFYDD